MSDPGTEAPTAPPVPKYMYRDLNQVPKPDELYPVPTDFVTCLVDIAPKIQESGAWWSLSGDLSENFLDVHIIPSEIEIVTDADGLDKISRALSGYGPSPLEVRERRLEREAELDGNRHPVFTRSRCVDLAVKGARVVIQGEYQMKVGEWEWGDSFLFDPIFVNVAGVRVPLMPLRLRAEIYLTLGWGDRVKMISDAYIRSQGRLHRLMEGS